MTPIILAQLEMKISGLPTNLSFEIPITIGNIPLKKFPPAGAPVPQENETPNLRKAKKKTSTSLPPENPHGFLQSKYPNLRKFRDYEIRNLIRK